MTAIVFLRLSILAGLSSTDLSRRIRARHLAARLGRRHGINCYA